MISVLGLSPERAVDLLAKEGISVTLQEARSKKGVVSGEQARVIRQVFTSDQHATLVYSVFQTEPAEPNL